MSNSSRSILDYADNIEQYEITIRNEFMNKSNKQIINLYKENPEGYEHDVLLLSELRNNLGNFKQHLEEIETSVNQILQGKPKLAINDFSRFIINSTIGLGGFLDVATKIGLTRHEEEFDQTLALWGVPSGPYIMLPGLGPSTLRDTLARPFSSFLSVTFHMTESDVNLALKGMDALETRERLLEIESLIYGDRYNFVRDSYVQYMNYEINDGVDVEDEFIDDMDDLLIEQ